MKKGVKILAGALAGFIAVAGITAGAIYKKTDSIIMKESDFPKFYIKDEDAVYFLNTGSSDAVILQSGGHYAMIDSGEDTDNPRNLPDLELPGYEEDVLNFLKRTFSDYDGNVHLDFILGTHSHSDHIGGFDTIINDDKVFIDKAYLKEYRSENIRQMEIDEWDNQEVYDQMVDALNAKSIPIISDIPSEPFKFGNFTITFMNTEYDDTKNIGENDNSVVTLIETADGKKVLLTGDLDNCNKDEQKIAEKVGKVDVLKVGHHSYGMSTMSKFISTVNPEMSIITNSSKSAYRPTLARIAVLTKSKIAFTEDNEGIAVVFKDGEIIYSNHKGL